MLVHLVDVSGSSGREPLHDFVTICRELELYNPDLTRKPQLVVANKIDALGEVSKLEALEAHARELGLSCLRISGVTGEGVPALLEAVWQVISPDRQGTIDAPPDAEFAPPAASNSTRSSEPTSDACRAER